MKGFFEKITKMDILLAKLIKRQREKTYINKIRAEAGDITTNTNEIKRKIREHCVSLL
jgi:hypothetical protein